MTQRKIWELWDAEELVSLHLTEQDAWDAREQHLDRYWDFPDDEDLLEGAVEIRATGICVGPPIEHEPVTPRQGRP